MNEPGRNCPLDYRYQPGDIATIPLRHTDTAYIAGGLYGNPFALETLLAMAADEPGPVTLVFNGDFNWFNAGEDDFSSINDAVLRHLALRGNVETELARAESDSGCGCAYPEWVDDDVVQHSNAIMARLRTVADTCPEVQRRLAALPMFTRLGVGDLRVGVVHGDARSLSGWDFAQEHLHGAVTSRQISDQARQASVDLFASSHTCLPVARVFGAGPRTALINNGAAGMPNFSGTQFGIVSRVSITPPPPGGSLYAARLGNVHVSAAPLRYDAAAFREWFLDTWSPGTAAHTSYFSRIVHGPRYRKTQAIGAGFTAGRPRAGFTRASKHEQVTEQAAPGAR